jgi:(E)-4-hydroxy-3-methylbut-2-enyl-diphosphate synthase
VPDLRPPAVRHGLGRLRVEQRLEAYADPIEVAVLGCAVNGIGEASHADFGITGAKDMGVVYSKGEPLRKVPTDELVDVLFHEIDKYYAAGRPWSSTRPRPRRARAAGRDRGRERARPDPERLAAMEAEAARAEPDRLDEEASPTAGRRFTRA